MSEDASILARGVSDAEDRLLTAAEPLAGLQLRCGGELPGTIAVPELLELVRKTRRYGFRLARAICAQDGGEKVTAWVEVEPCVGGEGCEIRVRSWHSAPIPSEDAGAVEYRRTLTERHLAELSVQLDAGQRVLAVVCETPELAEVAAAMEAGLGRLWTEFLPLEDVTHHQPLHWRLLDGARVRVAGSERNWRVALIPHMQPGLDPAGFELLLLSDEPAPQPLPEPAVPVAQTRRSLVGQDLAPVLKQPISRIIANAETIRTRLAGPLPDAYSDYAGEIASAGKLLLELLEDMADLEVVESEGFSTAPDRIDLCEVARQAAGILGVRAREKGIVIEPPQQGESLPAIAEFRRVLQVLLNLIGNAVRYSPENSRIWIRLEDVGDRARVIVADQGPGVSEEQQARMFEKFERLGRSGDGGTGLGLYISRSLAHAMGGDLTVDSAPGQGARFTLEVPADPDV
ncbi:sensor histidine kinase [Novosphingobium mangrovi (ex Huang et al. 2023)]|uniref:histidine kinase n=1 Tax=Novosphingobium mangrovi (ex Huang et al. 2023) TaxID=2976432 RepID=A0ABT2I3Y2_9SPHN|nr:HAMP domain-containing sensor histidine kinase [Novosphingobium mangrovi (ex Huang et al. 2023)]MCT2399513.1 HAMP domain-containing histidine kinase [Novosphingobium mangrovi (ex Huang et al. 2023)]